MTRSNLLRRARLDAALLASLAVLASYNITVAQSGGSNVAATRHNLTASGPGAVRTNQGGEVCSFCHTPHAANPIAPLWNRDNPGTYYQTYDSSTLKATVGQPTGSSRLCLSCHDGTIAINQTYNSQNLPGGALYISQSDSGFIGTDLSDDHPISFTYSATLATEQGELRTPSALPSQLPLDHNQQMQCSTCHDAHDDSNGRFLRMPNDRAQMCRTCHEVGNWATSAHATSNAALGGATRDDWANLPTASSVADASCESCHRPHGAGGRQRLLRHEAEENNCLNCHDGSVASADINASLQKVSTHPVATTTGVHDPAENPLTMTEHVECTDCHAPHTAGQPGTASAPFIRPSMAGASGLSRSGSPIAQATNEYEVCYKCHSTRNFASAVVDRLAGNQNIADEFATTNQSFHPVEAAGRSNNVPSLKQGLTTGSIIYCTDCHTSDAGAKGPHGSNHRPLLKSNYSTNINTTESPYAYAACYNCHNRSSILGDESFKEHREHLKEKVPCSACHDPHGVKNSTHLINFDTTLVKPSKKLGTGPTFTDLGNRRGSCTLLCHGEDHKNERY